MPSYKIKRTDLRNDEEFNQLLWKDQPCFIWSHCHITVFMDKHIFISKNTKKCQNSYHNTQIGN